MKGRKGVDQRKKGVCMVVDCNKKAIYKNPRRRGDSGGYCSDHRHMAMIGNDTTQVNRERWYARKVWND